MWRFSYLLCGCAICWRGKISLRIKRLHRKENITNHQLDRIKDNMEHWWKKKMYNSIEMLLKVSCKKSPLLNLLYLERHTSHSASHTE
jgi:hypothetical protein